MKAAETAAMDSAQARSFAAALCGFLGSTVATTMVLFLLSQA